VIVPDREKAGARRPRRPASAGAEAPTGVAAAVLEWQAAAGNNAVARLLARQPATETKPTETAGGDEEPPVTRKGFDGAQEWGDRAVRYYREGQWEKSRHAWEEAYKLSPVPTFLYNEAACLEQMGRIPEAIAMYKAYLADNPAETDVEQTREHVKRLEGGAGAGAPADQVARPGSGGGGGTTPAGGPGGSEADEPPVTRTGFDGAQEWGDRAVRYYREGQWEKSRHAWEEAYKLSPVPTFLYNEAACLEQMGRFAEAIAMYEAYLGANPAETDVDKTREHVRKLKDAHPGTGTPAPGEHPEEQPGPGGAPAQATPGQQQAAEEPITETGQKGAQKWFDRATAAYQAKDFEKAYDGFMHAYHLLPEPNFLYNAGAARQLGGDADAAIGLYDRYLAEKPDAADAAKVKAAIEKLKGRPMPDAEPGQGDGPPITETGVEGAGQWFDRATKAYLAKEFDKAYAAFMHAYHLSPRPDILYNAAAALDMSGRADDAIAMYDRYLAEKPRAGDAPKVKKRIEKLKTDAAGGQVDETGGSAGPAAGGDTPITATGKEGSKQWFERGEEQFQQGRYEDAVESFGKAYELDPLPDFVFDQGSALEKQGRPAAAAVAFERYLALAPGAKDYAEVVARVKKLRAAANTDPIADPWSDEAAGPDPTATGAEGARQWFDKAKAAYAVGDFKAAHAGFMHAYELLPQAAILYNAGAALQMDGDLKGAIDLYERYLAEDPGAADAPKVRKAIEKLKEKLGGDPGPGQVDGGAEGGEAADETPITATGKAGAAQWYERGEKQFRAGRFEQAVESFGHGFELDPKPEFVYDQAWALEKQGRVAAAVAAYERYLVLAPNAPNFDEVVQRAKKLQATAAAEPLVDPWADEAAGPEPAGEGKDGAHQWYAKSEAAFLVGDYKVARDGFLRAYALWPRAEFLFDAARALEEEGDTAGAIAMYERSLTESGGVKDAATARQRIDNLKQKTAAAPAAQP
jgi:tetratricopeptide (TPR) repeat protein